MELWTIVGVAAVVLVLAAVRRKRIGPMAKGVPPDGDALSKEDRRIAWNYIGWLAGLLIGATIMKELWARWQ